MAATGNTIWRSKSADCCSICWIAASGFATTLLRRFETVLNPAEIMAQHGSSPSWLRALVGRTMTTTASARIKASVLPMTLEMRVNDLRTTSLLLWVGKNLLYLFLKVACRRCALLQQRILVREFGCLLP